MKARKRTRAAASPPKTAAPAAPAVAPIAKSTLIAICAGLTLAILLVYVQTFHYGFVAYDDDQYVYVNAHVKAGLSAANIAWALTTFFYANWHPLTWISYMLDASLAGTKAGWFHAVNVMLHAGAAVLLFLALWRMTRRPWRCALVAAIFALHPLHVESVAWISERKDVLSTFLEMVALLLYAGYVERRTLGRYLAVAGVFALSLMAKPMLVTFPFVLLLLDLWPLKRIAWPPRWPQAKPLVWEKLPLLGLSAVASVLTYVAQRDYGAVVALEHFSLASRLANAAISYVAYIGMTLWPANLGVFYPANPAGAGEPILAVALLAVITVAAVRYVRTRPYLLSGWLWYVGMLVPVIGIVQVGLQARADRYTYVPMVGLSIAVIWLIGDWLEAHPGFQHLGAALGGVLVLAMGVGAYQQAEYWQNSRVLFEHTLAVTGGNYILRNNLGVVLADEGKFDEAAALYRESLALNPDYGDAHANLGHVMIKKGQFAAADAELSKAIRLRPDLAQAKGDYALVVAARGDYQLAARYLTEALKIAPINPSDQSNLCFVLLHLSQPQPAMQHCQEAIRLQPDFGNAHYNLGNALATQGRFAEARTEFTRALQLEPSNTAAKQALEALNSK